MWMCNVMNSELEPSKFGLKVVRSPAMHYLWRARLNISPEISACVDKSVKVMILVNDQQVSSFEPQLCDTNTRVWKIHIYIIHGGK